MNDSLPDAQRRSQHIAPFQVMAILEQAQALEAAGEDVIHLQVGEPDFATPEPMVEAAVTALRAGQTRYTPALGMPALRERLAHYYQQRFGVHISPRQVVLTPGASGALLLLTAARLEQGQTMLLADPGYPCNRHFARVFEAHGQLVPGDPTAGLQLTPQQVRQHWQAQTRVALVASPANPTGTVLSLPQLQGLHQAVSEQGGELWVDEIYQGLNYGAPGSDASQAPAIETALQLGQGDNLVVLNSFSKFFGMTGWRLGWAVVPEAWVETLDTLAQNLFLAPSTPAQHAALAAFGDDTLAILEARRQELQLRRDYLLQALPDLGFKLAVVPDGAFYVYADASDLTDDSLSFCQQALAATGVAFTPGTDFGEHQAKQHVRFAFTTPLSRLQQAMARLQQWLERR
ncbi:aminotransferase [Bacterioplanes sanyensis]|uniref:pyridoxal phosphate-dependent aminotransferase n=1 Tax=Bacterioplanes sanyensis TaxID=1249553 RepID=UPI001671D30C|nr:pyridoxal phosphate-dependent aminotransferase [Bacterioplanes sanyensis]GGY38809.1 aminotransferase [Bacterioplanes sanyensis]